MGTDHGGVARRICPCLVSEPCELQEIRCAAHVVTLLLHTLLYAEPLPQAVATGIFSQKGGIVLSPSSRIFCSYPYE